MAVDCGHNKVISEMLAALGGFGHNHNYNSQTALAINTLSHQTGRELSDKYSYGVFHLINQLEFTEALTRIFICILLLILSLLLIYIIHAVVITCIQ